MKFNWKIGGEAGFGIMTTGVVLSRIATRSGYNIFNYPEYPSLIRGGHNTLEVVISEEVIRAPKWEVDMLVCLNKETFDLHKHRLHKGSIVVYDPQDFTIEQEEYIKVPVPFKKIRTDEQINQMMINTVAMGASLSVMGGDLTIFEELLKEQFSRKGQEVVDYNLKLARIGFDHAEASHIHKIPLLVKKTEVHKQMVLTANDAFSVGTVIADCRYFAAYPMTPASSILMTLAAWQSKTKMVVRHSEDEIAVINSALGASYAGVRSAVSTSGGGFALMVEALSYAGVAEIPVVVYLGMRPGPATGMPTWTEQGDLLFAAHAGHGEFPKIVLAPGDTDEMVEMALKAYDLADIYQMPVLVLADKFICESYTNISHEKVTALTQQYKPNRGKIVFDTDSVPYLRYKDNEDGISEMLIPGKKEVFYQANSYEHIEDSHTTESPEARIQQVHKRQRKIDTYFKNHFEGPKLYGDPEATTVFVSWGGTKGIIQEAQSLLESQYQERTALLHFTHVYPLNEEIVKKCFLPDKRYILVENNSHGQFGQLLRMQTGIAIQEKILKYDGRPIWPEEIVAFMVQSFEKLDDDQKMLIQKLKGSIQTT